MGHDHDHEHRPHTHTHGQNEAVELPTWADPSVPESELDPAGMSRRNCSAMPDCSAVALPR